MKKLILALIALGFAFAISSCCNQSYCSGNMKGKKSQDQQEQPYRFDTQEQAQPGQERPPGCAPRRARCRTGPG